MKKVDVLAALKTHFPDIAENPSLSDAITKLTNKVSLNRGKTICFEGDSCTHLALITAGTARVYKLAESGREITLYRIEAGECCILTASCMLSGRTFPANATVEEDLQAILVPEHMVQTWVDEYETWRNFLWTLLAGRLGDVIGLIEEVAFRRMDERLADYLAEHARERGATLEATHQQIAADLGTSREVVSRMLKDFQLRGMLELGRGRITLHDIQGLKYIGRQRD